RPRGRLTAPDDPSRGVSREEFQELVQDLHVDAPPARTAVEDAPAPAPARPPEPDPAADADPSELYMKGDGGTDGKKRPPRKPRNRKHGRPR
ncbi:MAG TPA: hypothetical protein VGW10_05575, partial [Solirubrobacteraceae bacterium]|nr:hypothetical protein [Solirubrobacteraceae bacterium]